MQLYHILFGPLQHVSPVPESPTIVHRLPHIVNIENTYRIAHPALRPRPLVPERPQVRLEVARENRLG